MRHAFLRQSSSPIFVAFSYTSTVQEISDYFVSGGFLNVDKPTGISSARVVDRLKRLIGRRAKIGHAGTLDPFATGVLIILIGKATRSCERLMDLPKQYLATLKLGTTTPTDDPESTELPHPIIEQLQIPPQAAIETAMQSFIGEIMQRPPVFSAIKVGGRRAYDLARRGHPPQLSERPVRVYGIQIIRYAWPELVLRIDCGRGTYIRSLARDLGEALKVGAYLTALRRTRVGPFHESGALSLQALADAGIAPHLLPISFLENGNSVTESGWLPPAPPASHIPGSDSA